MDLVVYLMPDIIAIFALFLTYTLAKKSIVINIEKTHIFNYILMLCLTMIVLEIMSVILEENLQSGLTEILKLVNILGFLLCPAVPYMLMRYLSCSNNKKYNSFVMLLPFMINGIICLMSYRTEWIFGITESYNYFRGILFFMPTITSMVYYLIMIIELFRSRKKWQYNQRLVLHLIFGLPILSMLIQLLNKQVLLLWATVSISVIIFYICVREAQLKTDSLTQIQNRFSFDKDMDLLSQGTSNAYLIVFDVNNLKYINDKNGHTKGDKAISNAAKAINMSFRDIGVAYRIGGDEFCVIAKDAVFYQVQDCIENLEKNINNLNNKSDVPVNLAYGYAYYRCDIKENIYDIFREADKEMYYFKANMKKI